MEVISFTRPQAVAKASEIENGAGKRLLFLKKARCSDLLHDDLRGLGLSAGERCAIVKTVEAKVGQLVELNPSNR